MIRPGSSGNLPLRQGEFRLVCHPVHRRLTTCSEGARAPQVQSRLPGPISPYRGVIPLAAPAFWRLRTTNRFVNDLTLVMIVSGVVTTVFAVLVRLAWRRGKKLQQPLQAWLGAPARRAAPRHRPGVRRPDTAVAASGVQVPSAVRKAATTFAPWPAPSSASAAS